MIKIQIVYDNTSIREDLKADWGFAAFIQAYGKNILFDTGANGDILLANMDALDIDPLSISDVFISHCHFDHIGGLSAFLNKNNHVILHAPTSFRGVRTARGVIYYDKPQEIAKHFFSSGELENIEQSLAVETKKGLMIIVGCSHPAMENIFAALSPFGNIYGIVGGMHGFDHYQLFEGLKLICPTHCTQHSAEIKQHFPDVTIAGGAGTVIEI
jgi:7,8-dihydropterin-6-yl-methyl-4-(beta-D-ribofuranosyl)aminobenzene 5'-phosphate synthase